MSKFQMPKRLYCDGEKKMVSMRMPERLMKEVEALAEKNGWSVTDVIATVLDQYVQQEKVKGKR